MDRSIIQTREARFLLTAAAIVVIVAGLRAASPILVRFLLSLFIAVISAPVLFWLKRKGCPTGLALVLVILVILSSGMLLVAVVGTSLNDFSSALPAYQTRLLQQAGALFTWLEGKGIEVPHRVLLQYFDPGAAMRLAASILTSLSGVLTNAFFILLTVVFILLEASSFPEKLRSILEDPENSFIHLNKFVETVKRYIAIKTLVSLLTGVFITVWLQILGVDFALLWGLLAFMLNYVPTLGSFIAAIPAVLLTLVQLGVGPALLAGLGYLVVNLVMGNVLEPGLMGRRLGLSTLIVFLSLVFWGWVLGPIGMLLSVPLTMTLKIALESREETRKISFLLGSETTFPTPSPIQAETSPSASPDSGGPESSESAV
jgi:predicted PurR-regulated permease PerM